MKSKKIFICIFLSLIIIIPLLAVFISCNDDIFHTISLEEKVRTAFIKGSPTNFVIFKDSLYVASGKTLYIFDGSSWTTHEMDSKIIQLAATSSLLYVLLFEDITPLKFTIKKSSFGSNRNWIDIKVSNYKEFEDYTEIENIQSANNILYIGARKPNKNTIDSVIFKYDGNNFAKTSIPAGSSSSLRGAVYNGETFICTSGGIYRDNSAAPIPLSDDSSSKPDYIGIIKLEDNTIAAITRNGLLYQIDTVATKKAEFPDSRRASGAIATCKVDNKYFLLAGRQDISYSTSSGYTFGYVELELNASGGIEKDTFKVPGTEDPSSIEINERYSSSLGVVPVNHLVQYKNTLFAATHQKGVWSYRDRNNAPSWNSEEEEIPVNE